MQMSFGQIIDLAEAHRWTCDSIESLRTRLRKPRKSVYIKVLLTEFHPRLAYFKLRHAILDRWGYRPAVGHCCCP